MVINYSTFLVFVGKIKLNFVLFSTIFSSLHLQLQGRTSAPLKEGAMVHSKSCITFYLSLFLCVSGKAIMLFFFSPMYGPSIDVPPFLFTLRKVYFLLLSEDPFKVFCVIKVKSSKTSAPLNYCWKVQNLWLKKESYYEETEYHRPFSLLIQCRNSPERKTNLATAAMQIDEDIVVVVFVEKMWM